MADKVFNFNDQRRIGDIGESDFVKVYKKLKPKKSKTNFQIDFTLSNGKTVELKTDSYDMEKTPNFFMEQKTISGKKSNLGGPWRAKDHKIDYLFEITARHIAVTIIPNPKLIISGLV